MFAMKNTKPKKMILSFLNDNIIKYIVIGITKRDAQYSIGIFPLINVGYG